MKWFVMWKELFVCLWQTDKLSPDSAVNSIELFSIFQPSPKWHSCCVVLLVCALSIILNDRIWCVTANDWLIPDTGAKIVVVLCGAQLISLSSQQATFVPVSDVCIVVY